MKTFTATEARNQWFELLRSSVKEHRTYRITSKEGEVVLVSKEDYENLLETLELLSIPGMPKSTQQAKKEIKQGKTYSIKLEK